jgi:two-component system nitrate/nitrite response regulator NarL
MVSTSGCLRQRLALPSASARLSAHSHAGNDRRDEMKPLTSREREIALLVCTGLSNKQIARRLDLTEGTVKVHLHNIYVKFAIRNRTMLTLLALNLGVRAPTIESGVSLAA